MQFSTSLPKIVVRGQGGQGEGAGRAVSITRDFVSVAEGERG